MIRPDHHDHSETHHKRPSNFSVLISGIKEGIDISSLAKLFKEGKIAEDGEHEAFIGSPHINAPDGFHKINLPFMDPSHTASDSSKLPSIFIAPLGYKAPEGYKGHPLPFDPAPVDTIPSSTSKGKINLIHTTEPSLSSEDNDVTDSDSNHKTLKFKNPFLRNKLRNQRFPFKTIKTTEPSITIDLTNKEWREDTSDVKDEATGASNFVRSKIKFTRNRFKPQRKRVLTKIVRKPYTPTITTPTPTLETKKIVRIVDPTPVSGLKVEEYFPPTSGRPILGGSRSQDKVDLVIDHDYNITQIRQFTQGISTTFRPIQIKYIDLNLEPTKRSSLRAQDLEPKIYEPKLTENIPEPTEKKHVEIVDHFEPTTTHNNLIFDTTTSDEDTTYRKGETEDDKLSEELEQTTIIPSSFVTRNTAAPAVTTYKPSRKIIPFIPYSPAATTRSTTSSPPRTTEKSVSESTQSYEPTPFNFNLDPIARLEKLNRLKNKNFVKSWSSSSEKEDDNEYIIPTVRPTKTKVKENKFKVHSNRIKFRKYGYNQGKDDGRIFGQRIKQRKRPKLWENGYIRDDLYDTTTEAVETTTGKKSKKDEYKRKFRPFFDQLYERLKEKDKDTDSPPGKNRRISVFSVRRKIRPYNGWRKKSRSTTTPNPFTINAEIYEVHPESRARITTTVSSAPPPTFEVATESSTFYDVEEIDSKSSLLENVEKEHEDKDGYDSTDDTYNENDVHETADKHTPIHHDYELGDSTLDDEDSSESSSSILIPFKKPNRFKLDFDNEVDEFSHNGLVESNVALDFGESQFSHQDSLNEIKVSAPVSSVPPATRLLDQYQKTFEPSDQIANEHDSDYSKPQGIINEHSQQKLTVKEGDFIPFHNIREGDEWEQRPLVPYVEIERVRQPENKEPLPINVETVPTDTSLNSELIKEVLEGKYEIPASIDSTSFRLKDTEEQQNEIDDKPLSDEGNDYSNSEDYEEASSTTISIENEESETTTSPIRSRATEGDTTTRIYAAESTDKDLTEEQTTVSFFVTPTTVIINTDSDEIINDPNPTVQDGNTLILENVEGSDETTSSTLETTSNVALISDTTDLEGVTELTEEALPEGDVSTTSDEFEVKDHDTDTTTSKTTIADTTITDNFEVTTFRPKSNGGFFENFNLANLLSYIVPKRKTTTVAPLTTVTTAKTTEDQSEAVTDITTATVVSQKLETASKDFKESFTTDDLDEGTDLPINRLFSTNVPSTIRSEESNIDTTIYDDLEKPTAISKTSSVYIPFETTRIVSTSSPLEDEETTLRSMRYWPRRRYDTTTEQELFDETTKDVITFETTERDLQETTKDIDEDEYDQTTEANYITTTLSNRIRTERPFRGPFRLQKTFKNRYRLKNKDKKFASGLRARLEDKNKKESTISKAVYGAIKREEYIKNWVARKYNKLDNNSKKRLFSLNTTFQPPTTTESSSEETTPSEAPTTTESTSSVAAETTSSSPSRNNAALPFAPTIIPPKNKFFNVDLDVTIRDGGANKATSSLNAVKSAKKFISDKRKTFLDKLKSTARKSLSDSLYAKNIKDGKNSETISSSSISLPTQKSSKKISWAYPRGSNTNVFKTWGGNSLSQAEFERKVLGVSTATEVSVKSMICVRGRCYNADDKSLAKNN